MRRRHRRNSALRIKLRGKLRTYRAVQKLLKKRAKRVWRRSKKYHGRTRISWPRCRPCGHKRRRKGGKRSRKHGGKRAYRTFMKRFLKRHKKGGIRARMRALGRAWRRKHRR